MLEQCAAPRASVAKVAMSHGLNANMVHGWRKLSLGVDVAAARPAPSPAAVPAKPAASSPQFVPVTLTSSASTLAPADIRIELRRGATTMAITWPAAAGAHCAAWMRELLR